MKLNRRSLEAKALARDARDLRKSNPNKWARHDRYGTALRHGYRPFTPKPNKYTPHQGEQERQRRAARHGD